MQLTNITDTAILFLQQYIQFKFTIEIQFWRRPAFGPFWLGDVRLRQNGWK